MADDKETTPPPALESQAQNLITREGGGTAAVLLLMQENKQYRDRIRELETKQPTEGSVVLTPEQAKAWEAYQGIGTLEQVQGILTERDDLKGMVAKAGHERLLSEAAELAGYKPAVLGRLAGDALTIAIEGEGEQRRAVVKDGDATKPLSDYAKEQWGDFLPSLQREQPKAGTGYVPQQGGGTKPAGMVDEFKQRNHARAAAPNALRPAPAKG